MIPYVRAQADDVERNDPAGFPAVQRVALALSDALCARFAAW
jgi:hypothetical protein